MVNEKLKILRFLIENRTEEFSIRQIAKTRKINYKSAYNALKLLENEGVVSVKRKGNISLCSFNRKINPSVYFVENERRETILKDKNLKVLFERIKIIPEQFIILLFGSYAKGTQKKGSDIDILLIADDDEKVSNELDLLPLKTHLTHISYEDFVSMLKSKEMTVVSEAVKKNIILFGIEDYYRMIGNAK